MKASIASSDSSPVFFVPGDNDSISLLDTRDKQSHPFIPQQKTRGMVMCCYGNLSSTCVVGYESGHVCVYDCNTRQMLRELQVFKEPVISMAVASSLDSCACGSTGRDVVFCSLGEEMLSSRLELPNNGVLSLAIRGDDRLLAIGGKDGMRSENCGLQEEEATGFAPQSQRRSEWSVLREGQHPLFRGRGLSDYGVGNIQERKPLILFVSPFSFVSPLHSYINMETKKKHSEEVEELNKSIDAIFDAIPQFCQVASSFLPTHD
ncbi:hypothetical protein BLSTO_05452 [Blastocystis sp. subtype 1]